MKRAVVFIFISVLLAVALQAQSLLSYPRVKQAQAQKKELLLRKLRAIGVRDFNVQTLIVVYKEERILELWVRPGDRDTFRLMAVYPVCAISGDLGPKRQQGDMQVPEGFYYVQHFNPVSRFYLSLGINYPNGSDRILGVRDRPGGQIYIHGSCVSAGCVAITNAYIKEVFLMAMESKLRGRRVWVYIFPFRMTEDNLVRYGQDYVQDVAFWRNLQQGYELWTQTHRALRFGVNSRGEYVFFQ